MLALYDNLYKSLFFFNSYSMNINKRLKAKKKTILKTLNLKFSFLLIEL